MRLTELVGIADGALPLEVMKDHLRLARGFEDDGMQDALVRGYLRAAMAVIEGRIGKALILRSFVLSLGAIRAEQALPVAPVASVEAVTVVDAAGGELDVDGSCWVLQPDLMRPRLVARGAGFPPVPAGGRVDVLLEAGFGPWASVPPDLQQAVLLLAARFHEFRHEAEGGAALPFGVMALIERWRTVRVLGGGR